MLFITLLVSHLSSAHDLRGTEWMVKKITCMSEESPVSLDPRARFSLEFLTQDFFFAKITQPHNRTQISGRYYFKGPTQLCFQTDEITQSGTFSKSWKNEFCTNPVEFDQQLSVTWKGISDETRLGCPDGDMTTAVFEKL